MLITVIRYLKILDRALCRIMLFFLDLYKKWLSPYIAPRCRFYPTCSIYAMDVYREYGFFTGSWLTIKRLLKCHPFHPGGIDMPPKKNHTQ